MSETNLGSFLDRVRRRLGRAGAWRVAAWCLLAAASLGIAWALAWRVFGHAAPRWGYAVAAAGGLLAAGVGTILARRSRLQAAMVADRVFELKDGLLSWLEFRDEHRSGEVFELHEKSMERRVGSLDPDSVPASRRGRVWAAGAVAAVVALGLSLIPHSEAVRERLEREALTAERSAEVKRQLDEAVEELIKELSEEERELIDPGKLRELAAGIQQTEDQREAEKQIARFEAELAKAMQGLEARQDEAVLELSADELAKSQVADARQLGKELDAKDYEKARRELEELKPKAGRKLTEQELQELRKRVAKTKEMAKRMADGARQRNFGKNLKPGDKADGQPMEMAQGDQQPLQEMLEDLDAAARQLDGQLQQGEFDPDAQMAMGRLGDRMDELDRRLGRLGARQKARDKLGRLRAGMGQARQFAQGQAQMLGLAQSMMQSPNAGGLQAGRGSVESRRKERDEFKDNGNLAQLQGQQNDDGPSDKSVESAESGTGIAGRAAVAREREFRRQMESLVRRDDIPEELKLGVREYFERVHEVEAD